MLSVKKGQTIVEVMTAVGIAIVGLLALVQIATKSVNNSGLSARQARATSFASQGLESIRLAKQELGWTEFSSQYPGNTDYCGANLGGGCCTVGNEFTSCVRITYSTSPGGVAQMNVLSEVSWQEGNESEAGRTAVARQETIFIRY